MLLQKITKITTKLKKKKYLYKKNNKMLEKNFRSNFKHKLLIKIYYLI